MAKETAEQKLLKLIEATQAEDGGGSATPAPEAPPAAPAAREAMAAVQGGSASSLGMPSSFSGLINMLTHPAAVLQALASGGVRSVNTVVMAGLVVLGVYFFFDFQNGMSFSRRTVDFPVDSTARSVDIMLKAFQDAAAYLEVVSRRNIFIPIEQPEEVVEADEAEVPPLEKITKRTENFKLVGVSMIDSPDSATVMIEDTKTQVTHFKKKGEELQGVRIDKIYTNKVDLTFEGERISIEM